MKRYSKKLSPRENAERYVDNAIEIMRKYGSDLKLLKSKRKKIVDSLTQMVESLRRTSP